MKVFNAVMWTSMSVAAVGCDASLSGRSRQETVYVRREPAYVQQQPVYVQPLQPVYVQQQPRYVEQQPQYIIVQQAPPAVIVERRPSRPSVSHVWIDGYWNWNNQRYNWQAGRYVVPPQPDVVWVAARYENDGQGYRYTPGRWQKQNQGNGRGRGGI